MADENLDAGASQSAPVPAKGGYNKRPLWQWVLIYLVVGIIVYFVIYFVYSKLSGGSSPSLPY